MPNATREEALGPLHSINTVLKQRNLQKRYFVSSIIAGTKRLNIGIVILICSCGSPEFPSEIRIVGCGAWFVRSCTKKQSHGLHAEPRKPAMGAQPDI